MRLKLHSGAVLSLFMILIILSGGIPPTVKMDSKISPEVWADSDGGRTAEFLVIFKSQVELQQAKTTPAKDIGSALVQQLRQTAATSQGGLVELLNRWQAPYRPYWIVNLVAVRGGRELVLALAQRPEVAAIETNRAFKAALPATPPIEEPQGAQSTLLAPEWGLVNAHADDLWLLGYTGQGIVYANADTGVQWDHPALKNHYRGWDGVQADHNYNWWDAIHADISGNVDFICNPTPGVPCDDQFHGTWTMGIGVGDDGAGNQVGMAPGAKWIGCRNMDNGVGRPSTYIECLQFFIAPTDSSGNNPNPAKRPHIISNSYACPPTEQCDPHSLQAAVNAVRAAGIFMAVSAGNSGSACSTVADPPGLEAGVFTVGASDSTNSIASLSSRGPVTVDGSGRRKPDIVAPGIDIRSSSPGEGGVYFTASGTSGSAPHVAGAVALLWSAFPELQRNIFATELLLKKSAVAKTTGEGCGGDSLTAVPNNTYGYGILDVLAAYNRQLNNPMVVFEYKLPLVYRP